MLSKWIAAGHFIIIHYVSVAMLSSLSQKRFGRGYDNVDMTFSRKSTPLAKTAPEASEFDAFFQDHWERVCRALFNIVGDWDEAEDLALEAFLRLHRSPPRERENLAGWVYRVAVNLGFNALRDRKRRRQYEMDAGGLALASDTGGDPAQAAEQRLERQRVRRVLAAMKPRSAELLILRHSGLSYAEVAAALEITPASVGTLLARAEAEFEKLYQQEER
jgi:RNA polymerase sigma-70 factor, ECF subfamily